MSGCIWRQSWDSSWRTLPSEWIVTPQQTLDKIRYRSRHFSICLYRQDNFSFCAIMKIKHDNGLLLKTVTLHGWRCWCAPAQVASLGDLRLLLGWDAYFNPVCAEVSQGSTIAFLHFESGLRRNFTDQTSYGTFPLGLYIVGYFRLPIPG